MDEEYFLELAFERERPFEQPGLIGVSRVAVDHLHLRFHVERLTEDFDARLLLDEAASQRIGRLPRDDEDGVARVLNVVAQVMKDPPGFAHARGADDHHRPFLVVEGFGFICAADIGEFGELKYVAMNILGKILRCLIVEFAVGAEHLADVHRQRAVDVHGEARQRAALHHEVQAEDQFLGAAHGEGGNDDLAATVNRLLHQPPQLILRFVA